MERPGRLVTDRTVRVAVPCLDKRASDFFQRGRIAFGRQSESPKRCAANTKIVVAGTFHKLSFVQHLRAELPERVNHSLANHGIRILKTRRQRRARPQGNECIGSAIARHALVAPVTVKVAANDVEAVIV